MKNINPNSLQGKDRINKMRNLMGKMTLNENKTPLTKVEITKLGPDNKVYGIVKENHEYFIKTTDKIENVMVEDFNYIGGLGNKKQFAFESYSKALKKLNLKMISLNEQFGGDKVNVFENDHMIVSGDTVTDEEAFEEFVEEDVVSEYSSGRMREPSDSAAAGLEEIIRMVKQGAQRVPGFLDKLYSELEMLGAGAGRAIHGESEVNEYSPSTMREPSHSAEAGLEEIIRMVKQAASTTPGVLRRLYAELEMLGAGAGRAIRNEGELKVTNVIQDGPKELEGNTVGDFEDSKVEPDDSPNDKSTGTEKEGADKATPKKTIKETRKRLSILDALERFDDIVESVTNKKKTLSETKYKLRVDDPSPEPEPQGVSSGEESFNEPASQPAPEAVPMGDAPSDKPFDDTPFDAGVEADEQNEPKKFIQQLSGKLGQSLRTYTQDVGLDLELEKFAINSLLSATHTSEMTPEDKQDIVKRVESSDDVPDEEPMEEPGAEMDGADPTGATNPPSAPAPEGAAMGENFEVLDKEHKQVFKDAKLGVNESFEGNGLNIDHLCDQYKDNSKLVKELRYLEFISELKKVEPDAETIEMILAGNGIGNEVEKYSEVMENQDNPDDDFMSIADLERVEREIGSSIYGHDMFVDEEENTENTLSNNDKKDSFVDRETDHAIKRMMNDYLNTQHGFHQPEPQTKPKVVPETQPTRVPRRSRPYRVSPNVNPTPKGTV